MISPWYRKSAGILLLLILVLSGVIGESQAADYVQGEILVRFKAGTDRGRAGDLHSAAGAVGIVEYKEAGIEKIELPGNMSVADAVEFYSQDPDVEYAEPNYIIHAAATFPNDTDFAELWGLHNTGQSGGTADADIDAPEAWDTVTGAGNIVIAVIDSGIDYNHPDLASNMWTNSGETNCSDNIDNDGNGYIDDCRGWDFVDDDADPMDFLGHGTHIAGTIAAVGNNGTGITGVMWAAKIIPLRILDITGVGDTAKALDAIEYAKAKGARIINTSWVGSGFSTPLKDAIDNSNALVISSAGNSGTDNDDVLDTYYPASFDSTNIISVAATTDNDTLAPFSNFGVTSVDIGAPGVNIYSTVPARDTLLSDDFDDGNLLNPTWTVSGSWGASIDYSISGAYSLSDSPGTEYTINVDSFAQTSVLNLAGQTGCKLLYWIRLFLDPGDVLYVEASSNATSWNTLATYTTSVTVFREFIESLNGLEGQSTVYIRFRLETDGSGTEEGAYIDNLSITCSSTTFTGTEYEYEGGTSMVAPYVTGVAGLLFALHPTLSPCQIRDMILNNVDAVAALSGLIGTGGRLNAVRAVRAVPGPDTCPVAVTGSGGGGGGCFIATAAYGSSLHPLVKELRNFRDRHLMSNNAGRILVNTYYKYSPPVAKIIEQSRVLKFFTRLFITPLALFVLFPCLSFSIITVLLLAGLHLRYRLARRKSI